MSETKTGELFAQLKSAGTDGSFTGTLSTYGNIDLVGDICEKGCFDDSVSMRGPHRPLLYQHDTSQPIGSFDVISTEDALNIVGKFNLEVQRGREAYALLKAGDVDGLSIGYNVMAEGYKYDGDGVRHLLKVDLLEGSFVTFPANTLARAQAKSRRLERMSRFAGMKSLESLDEETRKEILEELDEMEGETDRGTGTEEDPEKGCDPEKEKGCGDAETEDMKEDGDQTSEDMKEDGADAGERDGEPTEDQLREFLMRVHEGCEKFLDSMKE